MIHVLEKHNKIAIITYGQPSEPRNLRGEFPKVRLIGAIIVLPERLACGLRERRARHPCGQRTLDSTPGQRGQTQECDTQLHYAPPDYKLADFLGPERTCTHTDARSKVWFGVAGCSTCVLLTLANRSSGKSQRLLERSPDSRESESASCHAVETVVKAVDAHFHSIPALKCSKLSTNANRGSRCQCGLALRVHDWRGSTKSSTVPPDCGDRRGPKHVPTAINSSPLAQLASQAKRADRGGIALIEITRTGT